MQFWRRKPGPSGFGPASTAEEVTAGIDASHITAIVTGGTSGIGQETVRVLALRGANVIIAARTLASGMRAKQSLTNGGQIPGSKLYVMEMDLSSLDSVRSFAKCFESSHEHLNLIINNAGLLLHSFELSKDGIELQFATNYLGHFLLTDLLLDKMKATAKKTGVQGRIINVSSVAHTYSDGSCFDLKNISDESKSSRLYAYPNSKLANVLHAKELSRRFQVEGCNLTANSLHPGIISTNISRHSTLLGWAISFMKPCLKSIFQVQSIALNNPHTCAIVNLGAATTCYLSLHPDVEHMSGKYFADCKEGIPSELANSEALARKLWVSSVELVRRTSSISV